MDDEELFNNALSMLLKQEDYCVLSFHSADAFLIWFRENPKGCDLILTDVRMPGASGFDLCAAVRASSDGERIPIVMVTGNDPNAEKAAGLNVGADDFISKPFHKNDLLAKIRSLLNIRAEGMARINRLARFVSPTVADYAVSDSKRSLLEPHQASVTVMFIDLRGFTAFSESVEPGRVLETLNAYYAAVGDVCLRYRATLGHLAGDGIMSFLNDPIPIESHREVGLKMALEVREVMAQQKSEWHKNGYALDFGIGLAEGPAVIGGIGFNRFWQYSVIGPVANMASRLCMMAIREQILVTERFLGFVPKEQFVIEFVGEVDVKGFQRSVKVSNIVSDSNASKLKITG